MTLSLAYKQMISYFYITLNVSWYVNDDVHVSNDYDSGNIVTFICSGAGSLEESTVHN